MQNNGGSAFPIPDEGQGWGSAGMSLRDWFAGLVLAAMTVNGTGAKWEDDAVAAYIAADAMLKAREAGDAG